MSKFKSRRLTLDFETYSAVDLRRAGTDVYACDASTEALMLAYAFEGGEVEQVVFAEGESLSQSLLHDLLDPKIIKSAWNTTFERSIFKYVLGIDIPIEQWEDPMAVAYSLALPGALGLCGEAVGLPEDKAKYNRGRALVRRFCVPRTPTKNLPHTRATPKTDPMEWEEFKHYNRQDVEAERAVWARIRKWGLNEKEQAVWRLDQKINSAGIPININMVHNAAELYKVFTNGFLSEIESITGVSNANSTVQLLGWLESYGYPYPDLTKANVQRAADNLDLPREVRKVASLRLEAAKSSVKKYDALARATSPDGNLRHTIQYCGAGRTGRFSGRIYQPQNLPRPSREFESMMELAAHHVEHLDAGEISMLYDNPMDLLVSCIRPAAQAPKGYLFIDADLGAIENRVLGWVVGCEKILKVFREGRDPYVDFATYMFNQSYDDLMAEVRAGDKSKRAIAKPAVLGSGYGMAAGEERENPKTGEVESTGLLGYARSMGVDMTQEEAQYATDVFRSTYSEVVDFWHGLERAARRCIQTRKTTKCGMLFFEFDNPFLRVRLPSGRYLSYCYPRIEPRQAPWGEWKDTITYYGLNEQNQWVRLQTRGAKLIENVVQAIARDVLVEGLLLADEKGLDVRMHIHDQIVALSPEDRADADLALLIECMTQTPVWAKGLPLGAEGFTSSVFKKD